MLCPKTLKPCCDDLCHGSGCLATGSEMIPTCSQCGGPMMTDDGEPDNSGLLCDKCAYSDDIVTCDPSD
jgi:hypothetical protein